ncbi:MAG: hypothetical protein KFH87_10495 [Bacteroidetes bacterium]|nr:hypothetical protein [Bacteroidota bacterium]
MKNIAGLILVCVILLSGNSSVTAQDTEYVYISLTTERTTLKEILDAGRSGEDKSRYSIFGDWHSVFVKITKNERRMTEKTRSALSLWISMDEDRRNLDYSRYEVEVRSGDITMWMAINRVVRNTLFNETEAAEGVYLHLRIVGYEEDQVIMYIDSYSTMDSMGKERVLQDALETAISFNDPTESLAIIEEIRNGSQRMKWELEETDLYVINYVAGVSYWKLGEHERAEEHLGIAERYMHSHPEHELSLRMKEGLIKIGKDTE